MDNLLLPLLNARDEQEREERLTDWPTIDVAPKDALRDAFRRQNDLASWQCEGENLYGVAAWREKLKRVIE